MENCPLWAPSFCGKLVQVYVRKLIKDESVSELEADFLFEFPVWVPALITTNDEL